MRKALKRLEAALERGRDAARMRRTNELVAGAIPKFYDVKPPGISWRVRLRPRPVYCVTCFRSSAHMEVLTPILEGLKCPKCGTVGKFDADLDREYPYLYRLPAPEVLPL